MPASELASALCCTLSHQDSRVLLDPPPHPLASQQLMIAPLAVLIACSPDFRKAWSQAHGLITKILSVPSLLRWDGYKRPLFAKSHLLLSIPALPSTARLSADQWFICSDAGTLSTTLLFCPALSRTVRYARTSKSQPLILALVLPILSSSPTATPWFRSRQSARYPHNGPRPELSLASPSPGPGSATASLLI